jgi:hypothetical protein
MINNLLKAHLEPVARRQRRLRLRLKLAAGWFVVALVGLVIFAFERQGGWTSSLVLPGLALLGVITALVIIIRNRRIAPDWRELANRIEAEHRDLNGRLLTAVQQPAGEASELNYLQERIVREAALHSQRADWRQTFPGFKLAFAQLVQLLGLALFAFVLWQLRTTGGPRLFARTIESGVTVTPGDTSLERGNSLVVLARFGGALPATVDLVVHPQAGIAQRIVLAKSLADPMFGGSVPEVASNLVYHVEYAGERTRDFHVTVFEYPRLERADADLTFPDYTGQPPKRIEDTRRVSVVEGTHLDLALQLNKPVAAARLVPRDKNGSAIPLTVETNRASATLKQFALTTATGKAYELQLTDAEGRTNKAPIPFVFAVLTNRTPELHLASPRGDQRPSPIEEISFDGTVWDDFGVQAYGLGYALVGQEPKFIELGRGVPAKEKRSFQYTLRLEDLGVEPDQLVSWFVWADDIGSDGQVRRTPGDLFFGEVRPFEEVFREGQGQAGGEAQNQAGGNQSGGQGNQTARLADLQKQIISATWRLQRENSGSSKAPARETPSPRPAPAVKPVSLREQMPRLFSSPQAFGQRPRQQPSANPSAGNRSGNNSLLATNKPANYGDDVVVVRDSQEQALDQARTAQENQQDPRTTALWTEATKQMEEALAKLEKATNSPAALRDALAAEQAAYQALLKVQQHEYSVSRSRNQRGGQQSGSSREQQLQRQLDQLDLTQSENRYETQRQAQAPQPAQRREQLQVMNRLQELARRQQDLNDRLRELQTALQEARTEQERADIQRRLKRLQEEEQQMLADVDELRQRMDRPENQSQLADERQQLDQTRQDVQRAAQAAGQDAASQALASGTRAQRQLQQIHDDLRRENSSQFADDLREMRNQARELSRQQEDILKKMEQETGSDHRSLSDSGPRQQMLDQLAKQKQMMTNLVDRAAQMSQDAETAEPLLSRGLYDTVRKFNTDSANDLKDVQDQLVDHGLMPRNLYDQLKNSTEQDGAKLMDLTTEMVKLDFLPPASETARRSGSSLNNLKSGVERAAESVLGDDTEALRAAQEQLNQLTDELTREMNQGGTNANQQASAGSRNAGNRNAGNRPGNNDRQGQPQNSGQRGDQGDQAGSQPTQGENQNGQQGDQAGSRENNSGRGNQGQRSDRQTASANQNQPGGDRTGNGETQPTDLTAQDAQGQGGGQRSGQAQTAQAGRDGQTQTAQANRNGGQVRDSAQGGQNRNGGQVDAGGNNGGEGGGADNWGGRVGNILDRFANDDRTWTAPITGPGFVPWSDRLRDVEEMIDSPDLRNQVAMARERARLLRQQFTRTREKPDWAVVQLQVVKPLVEVRDRIAEELARRGSEQALVPLDRDPVPTRYSDLVRKYYEELGKAK